MNDLTASMDGKHQGLREWSLAMGASAFIHIAVVAGFVICSLWAGGGGSGGGTGVVDVDLVSLFPSSGMQGSGFQSSKDEETASSETTVSDPAMDVTHNVDEPVETDKRLSIPSKSDPVSLAVKSPELKKDSPSDEDEERDNVRKKSAKSPSPPSSSELSNEKSLQEGTGGGAAGTAAVSGEKTGAGEGTGLFLSLDQYRELIRQMIRSNWAFSPGSHGNKPKTETKVAFEVMPNGDIRCVRLQRFSGSTFMDEAAMASVKRTGTVLPHPQGVNRPYVEMVVVFTPNDLY